MDPIEAAAEIARTGVLPGSSDAPLSSEAPAGDSSVNWSDMSADIEEEDGEVGAALEEDETPESGEEAPTTPPSEDDAEAPAEEEAAAEEIPAEVPVEEAPALTQEERQAQRAAYVGAMEQYYALPEEMAAQLISEPEKVLPILAANLHVAVLEQVMQQVQRVVPQVLRQAQVGDVRETQAKGEFFKAWPELKGYDKQIMEVGKMYRAMNPSASPEEAIRRIGETAMTALGIQKKAKGAQPPAPTPAKLKAKGFQPAGVGRVTSTAPSKSEWEALADDDD